MLSEFADMTEALNKQMDDIESLANVRFMKDFRDAMLRHGMPDYAAEIVLAGSTVNLDGYDANDPDFKRIIENSAQAYAKAFRYFKANFVNAGPFLQKFTFKLEV